MMALIKCPICGNDVSTHSKACPKCGEPVHEVMPTEEQRLKIKEHLRKNMNFCLVNIAVALIALIMAGYYRNILGEYKIYSYSTPAIYLLVYFIKFLVLQKKYERE